MSTFVIIVVSILILGLVILTDNGSGKKGISPALRAAQAKGKKEAAVKKKKEEEAKLRRQFAKADAIDRAEAKAKDKAKAETKAEADRKEAFSKERLAANNAALRKQMKESKAREFLDQYDKVFFDTNVMMGDDGEANQYRTNQLFQFLIENNQRIYIIQKVVDELENIRNNKTKSSEARRKAKQGLLRLNRMGDLARFEELKLTPEKKAYADPKFYDMFKKHTENIAFVTKDTTLGIRARSSKQNSANPDLGEIIDTHYLMRMIGI